MASSLYLMHLGSCIHQNKISNLNDEYNFLEIPCPLNSLMIRNKNNLRRNPPEVLVTSGEILSTKIICIISQTTVRLF